MIRKFPLAAKTSRDFCLEPRGCKPADACTGGNRFCSENRRGACRKRYGGVSLQELKQSPRKLDILQRLGANTCSDPYMYQQNNCALQNVGNGTDQIPLNCRNTLQCRVRSVRPCVKALLDVCKCPPDWQLGSHRCLKTCLRSGANITKIKNAGCDFIGS